MRDVVVFLVLKPHSITRNDTCISVHWGGIVIIITIIVVLIVQLLHLQLARLPTAHPVITNICVCVLCHSSLITPAVILQMSLNISNMKPCLHANTHAEGTTIATHH